MYAFTVKPAVPVRPIAWACG